MARSTWGSSDDLTGLVAHHDDLAHLGQGHETAVVGVVTSHALVEQHVFGCVRDGSPRTPAAATG